MEDQTPPLPETAKPSDWLPPLVLLADHDDAPKEYLEAVYGYFRRDFVESQPQFRGRWVRHRRDPIYDGKEAGFWHCISEGKTEDERTPDIRRCERIRWLRAILENATDPRVDVWENERGTERRVLIWFDEAYLIVLAPRSRQRDGFQYYYLLTAYATPEEHRKEKLRRERDAYTEDV